MLRQATEVNNPTTESNVVRASVLLSSRVDGRRIGSIGLSLELKMLHIFVLIII
jgi:hypothetical protein